MEELKYEHYLYIKKETKNSLKILFNFDHYLCLVGLIFHRLF